MKFKHIKTSACLIILVLISNVIHAQVDLSFNHPVKEVGDSSRFNEGATVNALARQADGKLLVGGDFSTYNGRPRKNFCRLMPDGSLDNDFIAAGGFDREVNCITLQPDGKILVGGHFATYNGQMSTSIIRLNVDGSIDRTFSVGNGFYFGERSYNYSSGNGNVHAILLMPDGKILVGGYFVNYNGQKSPGLVRLNQDGSIDRTFQNYFTDGSEEVFALALHKGRILVGGRFNKYSGVTTNGFVKVMMNGSLDVGFNLGGEGMQFETVIRSISVQPDNKIILVGRITRYNGYEIGNIIRLNENGWIDKKFFLSRFNKTDLHTTLIDESGNIYVGGEFTQYHDLVRGGIIKLMPNGTPDKNALATNIFGDVVVKTLLKTEDGNIIVGGRFSKLSFHFRKSIGVIDGKDGKIIAGLFSPSWGFDGPVQKIIPLGDKKYLVAGDFTTFNSRLVYNMMVINESGERDTSFLFPFYKYTLESLNDIQLQKDGKILIAGQIADNDNKRFALVRFNNDGSPDESFFTGGGFGRESVNSIQIQPDGKILVGGTFEKYDGVPVNGVIRLNTNGTLDNSFKPMLKTEASKILLDKQGYVYVLGISRLNNEIVSNIIRYTPTGVYDKTFNPAKAGYSRADVVAIAMQQDGKILLGGVFTIANNERYEGIIRVLNDGMPDNTFRLDKQIAKCGSTVSVIHPLNDGRILVGFAERYVEYRKENALGMNLIRLTPDGLINGQYLMQYGFAEEESRKHSYKMISDVAITEDNKIIVAGSFYQIDENIIYNLAKLTGETFTNKVSVETTAANSSVSGSTQPAAKTSTSKTPSATPNTSTKTNSNTGKNEPTSGALNFLRQLNGKDPMGIKILDHPGIKPRIRKILSTDFLERYQTFCDEGVRADPIQVNGNYAFIFVLGKSRSQGSLKLYFDLENDLVYARFGSAHAEDPPFVFGEKGAKRIPARLEAMFR